MGKKKIFKVVKYTPGLVADVNINNNAGYTEFKNLLINSMGKIEKRKGWEEQELVTLSTDSANLTSSTAYNVLDVDNDNNTLIKNFPLYDFIKVVDNRDDTLKTSLGVASNRFKELLRFKIFPSTAVNMYCDTYYTDGAKIQSVNITPNSELAKAGSVKVIETPNQNYILHDYKYNDKSMNVWKYNFRRDRCGNFENRIKNLSIMGGSVQSTFTAGYDMINISTIGSATQEFYNVNKYTGFFMLPYTETKTRWNYKYDGNRIEKGIYYYLIVPVYNTGSFGTRYVFKDSGSGAIDSYEVNINYNVPPVGDTVPAGKVDIAINPIWDENIIFYRIYRTRKVDYLDETDPTEQAKIRENYRTGDYYFVAQVAQPTTPANVINFTDTIHDNYLGDRLLNDDVINSVKVTSSNDSSQSASTASPQIYNTSYGMKASCGCYAHNKLLLGGDRSNPKALYVSKERETDSFLASRIYWLDYASLDNEQTAIESIGSNVFVFLNKGIYRLTPTASNDIPYNLALINKDIGCDSLTAITVLDNKAYFISNNKMYSIDTYGNVQEVSGTINTLLSELSTVKPKYTLATDNKNRAVRVMFRSNDSNYARNYLFYPDDTMWVEETLKRDTYERTADGIATLYSGVERNALICYDYNKSLDEEWGITYQGNLVKRLSTWADESLSNTKLAWAGGALDSASASATKYPDYNVSGSMIKPFVFNSRVIANSFIIYGNGTVKYAIQTDETDFETDESDLRTITLSRMGTEIPCNRIGQIFKLKIVHDTNEEIDIDYFEIKITGQTGIDMKNTVSAGA